MGHLTQNNFIPYRCLAVGVWQQRRTHVRVLQSLMAVMVAGADDFITPSRRDSRRLLRQSWTILQIAWMVLTFFLYLQFVLSNLDHTRTGKITVFHFGILILTVDETKINIIVRKHVFRIINQIYFYMKKNQFIILLVQYLAQEKTMFCYFFIAEP